MTEDCRNCHRPHGSINNNLLTARMPFLCYQCHKNRHSYTGIYTKNFTRCTDCHSEIHGTDTPGILDGGGEMVR